MIQVWPKSNPIWLSNGGYEEIRGIRSSRQSAWRTVGGGSQHCTGGRDQNHPKEKEMQEAHALRGFKARSLQGIPAPRSEKWQERYATKKFSDFLWVAK